MEVCFTFQMNKKLLTELNEQILVACSCSNTYMCHSQKVWDHGGDTSRPASTAGKSPTAGLPSAPLCREEQEHWHRALQNDLQQVTRVHVPVPRRPYMYKHYTEQFRSATSISTGDLVSARDYSVFILSTSFSTLESNQASLGHIHGLIRSMLLLPCHRRRLYILYIQYVYLDPGFFLERFFIIALRRTVHSWVLF